MSTRKRAAQLLAAVRTVNRLMRERKRINRRLKAIKHELKLARAEVRAAMARVEDIGPDIVPSRLTAGASGFRAELPKRPRADVPGAGRIDDLEPFEK